MGPVFLFWEDLCYTLSLLPLQPRKVVIDIGNNHKRNARQDINKKQKTKNDANEFYVYMKNVLMVLHENIFEYGPKVSMDHISWWKKKKSWRLDHKLKSNEKCHEYPINQTLKKRSIYKIWDEYMLTNQMQRGVIYKKTILYRCIKQHLWLNFYV